MAKYLTPGPVQLPRRVIEAMAIQPLFHRTEEFRRAFREVVDKLRTLYSYGEPVIIPGTGTLAVDAAVYNYIKPGENVLVVVHGEFGERLAESVESRGANVKILRSELGDVVPVDAVEDEAKRLKPSAIALVHNETSTGVCARYICRLQDVASSLGVTLIVDTVSGFPAEPIECRVDVLTLASQKALLAPPGASLLYVSAKPRAVQGVPPSIRLDKFLEKLGSFDMPYTPPINVVLALNASLSYILEMGLQRYQEMHRRRAEYVFSNVKLNPVPKRPEVRSVTIAVFYAEKAREIVEEVKKRGYVIAGGLGELRGRSVRIGLMGEVSDEDLKTVVEVINGLVD